MTQLKNENARLQTDVLNKDILCDRLKEDLKNIQATNKNVSTFNN